MKISNKAIDNPLNTSLFLISILIMGYFSFQLLTVELFPEIDIPKIIIKVVYKQASPREIEFEINKKIEDELKNIKNIKKIESVASNGVGTTIIDFHEGVNIIEKKDEVKNAVDKILPDMPKDIEKPVIWDLDLSETPVMHLVMYSEQQDYITLKDYAKHLKDELLNIQGVGNIEISGGLDREISIHVDPVAMWGNQVNVLDVIQFFQGGNKYTSTGKMLLGQREYSLGIKARFQDEYDIKEAVLFYRDGKPVYLKELGTITQGTKELESLARYNGVPAISLGIIKQSKSNLLHLSQKIHHALEVIQTSNALPKDIHLVIAGDQSQEIQKQINDLTNNIVQGTIIVLLTLYLTLGLRNAVIASLSIPFALLFAMLGLYIFDESINQLTQFGLIIVIGIIVDGTIVILENINQHKERGESSKTAAKKGVDEVGKAVISSGLTTMSAFAPMLFMTGIVGQFMSLIPKTVIIALTGALLFDHIVIPMLCSRLFKNKPYVHSQAPWEKILNFLFKSVTPIPQRIMKHYHRMLVWACSHRKTALVYAGIGLVVGIVLLGTRPKELFPEVDLGKFWVVLQLAHGSSIDTTNALTQQVEALIAPYLETEKNPKGLLQYYLASIGSTGISTGSNRIQINGTHIAQIEIKMIDSKKRRISIDQFMTQLRKTLISRVSGATIILEKPKSGPPTGKPVNIVVSGEDIRVLKQISEKAKTILRQVPGAVEVMDNYGPGKLEVQVKIHESMVERYGLNVQEIQALIAVLNHGYALSTYQYGQETYEIRIKASKNFHSPLDDFKITPIYSRVLHQAVPITALASITLESGLSSIHRQNFKRTLTVSADVDRSSYTTAEVTHAAIQAFENLHMPKGYSIDFTGENEDRDESFEGLKFAFIIGVMMIYFIVVIELKSFLQPFNILTAMPLSVLGIGFGLTLANQNLSVPAMFGIVSLTGIVVNDSIVLLSQINTIRAEGSNLFDAIIQAGTRRLRPILLTTFTTIGSLLPLALAIGSQNFLTAMGWSIIGGLLFSTFQVLIILPVLYIQSELLKNKLHSLIKKYTDKNKALYELF